MITSIICIVFGVMFCIWPGTILVTLCRIAGLVLLAAGIVLLVQGIRIREMLGRSVRMLPAVVCVVIGIWILARPGVFVSLIPILISMCQWGSQHKSDYVQDKAKEYDNDNQTC